MAGFLSASPAIIRAKSGKAGAKQRQTGGRPSACPSDFPLSNRHELMRAVSDFSHMQTIKLLLQVLAKYAKKRFTRFIVAASI
jgi:hypothetical protein